MKRYEIYPHLSDDIIAIEDNKGEYVKHDQAHALLKEAYEYIAVVSYQAQKGLTMKCKCCGVSGTHDELIHKPDCIVLKATEYLEREG